jgi:hypothetical protein
MAQLTPATGIENKYILWLKWTAAFVLAEAIMLPVMQYVPAFLARLIPQLNTYPNLIRLPIIILNGFVYGVFSAYAIRKYLPNFLLWILLSSTAWIMGLIVSISPVIQSQLSSSSFSTIFGIIASLVTLVPHGIMQWLMLRTHYQKSGFLILWYFMAGVIINLIFGLLFTYVPAVSQFLSGSSYWIIWGFNLLVEFLLFGITGIGIILVLKAPYSDPREPDPERRSAMELLVKWVLYTLVFLTIFTIFQAAGWLSSIATGIFSNPPWDALLIGLIYGLILGCMQFLFFRQQVDHAYLWIIASIVGGGLLYISQSAGTHTNLLTGSQNQPAIYLILAFQALGWLALGVAQAVILNYWQYSKAWAWVLITFASYGLSYLVQFFISQRFGLVLLPVLTGFGLLYIIRAENGKTWFVAPVNSFNLTPDDYETLRFILQARLNDMPGKKMKVFPAGNRLSIPSVDLSLDDTLTSLLTQPGKVSIYRSTSPTRDSASTSETIPPVFTDQDFVCADVKPESEPDQQLIQLTLAEECAGLFEAELKLDPAATFYLYVDGELIHNAPIEISDEFILKIRHLAAEDACYYRAILNNDALPFAVSLDKTASEAPGE